MCSAGPDRAQRLLVAGFVLGSMAALAQALIGGKPTWALALPFFVLVELARPAREAEADL